LRTSGAGKVTKAATKGDTIPERERLKQVVERLSVIESSVNAKSSSPQPIPDTSHQAIPVASPRPILDVLSTATPHIPLQAPSTLTSGDFEVGGTLGKGKFGRVFLARYLSTNYICALKILSKASCSSSSEEKLIRREIEVHQNLFHRNILKLLSWFHDATNIYLVLEYAPGGSLYTRLKKQPKGYFDEPTTARYIAQTAHALRYMHAKNILHRDIKPENILFGLHGEIKLADFGYAVHSDSNMRSTVCGTLDYLAPEVAVMMPNPGQSDEFYTNAVDRWSLGVLMYELLVGKPPFEMKSSEKTHRKIAEFKGEGIKFPRHVSGEARALVGESLNLEADQRLGFDGVLGHEWVVRHVDKEVKRAGIRSLGRMVKGDV
jgi:aurora kinase